MSDFDLYKENIQPRRKGHSARELENLSKLSNGFWLVIFQSKFYAFEIDFCQVGNDNHFVSLRLKPNQDILKVKV